VTSFYSFFGFLNKATADTPERIFRHNTSKKDVVPGKEVPFRQSITIFDIWTLKFPKNRHFGTDIDWTSAESRFNTGMLQYKTTLNRRSSPIKVV